MNQLFCRKKIQLLFLSSWIIFAKIVCADNNTNVIPQEENISPVGYWQTIDDATNQARSIIKICRLNNGQLFGRLIQVNYTAEEKPTDTCTLCSDKDSRRGQLILGTILLTNMHKDATNKLIWDDGHVLDPKNGKVYNAKITMDPQGDLLTLRGYIGFSLLGRSQTWHRIDETNLSSLVGTPVERFTGYVETNTGKYLAAHYDACAQIQSDVNAMTN